MVPEPPQKHVAEAPSQVMPGGVEPTPRKVGHLALDLIIAGSAILISCISLFIAIQQSRTMQKQVAASSWPLLQYASGNTDDANERVISMTITNAGVGPALVKRFRITYGGRSYDNYYEFLADCCGYSIAQVDSTKIVPGVPLTAFVDGTVIRAGETKNFLNMALASNNIEAWKRLDRERFKVSFDTCYCSVLRECWRSDLTGLNPDPVDQCPAAEKRRP